MDDMAILHTARLAVAALAALLLAAAPLRVAGADTPAPTVEFLNSGTVLPPNLPFAEAVRHGDTLYLSGQIGVTPGKLQLVPGGIRAEARQALDNIRAVLEAHGRSVGDILKCTVMLADMADWPALNDVWRDFFKGRYPARSALGANGLALGARVEIECIAAARS